VAVLVVDFQLLPFSLVSLADLSSSGKRRQIPPKEVCSKLQRDPPPTAGGCVSPMKRLGTTTKRLPFWVEVTVGGGSGYILHKTTFSLSLSPTRRLHREPGDSWPGRDRVTGGGAS
jgi:hypothetical protein